MNFLFKVVQAEFDKANAIKQVCILIKIDVVFLTRNLLF